MIGFTLDMRHVAHLIDGKGGARVKRSVAAAIPKGLRLMEEYHKKGEFYRGRGAARPVARHVTSRTGTLSRSFRIYHRGGDLIGYYGSELPRARILEEGGTIRGKGGGYLAIPTGNTMVGVSGKNMWPSDYPKGFLFRIGDTLFAARKLAKRSDLVPMFTLRKQVTIPPRPMLSRTLTARSDQVEKLILDTAMKGLDNRA